MKNTFLILVLLYTPMCFSQAIIGNSYVTVANNVNVHAIHDASYSYKIPTGTKFRIDDIDEESSMVLISFWSYKKKFTEEDFTDALSAEMKAANTILLNKKRNELTKEDGYVKYELRKEFIGPWSNYLQFKMSLRDLNDKTIRYHEFARGFTYGVMTLPIKARFGNGEDRFFEFEENLNLGFNFGYSWQLAGLNRQAINALIGVGVSRVTFTTDSYSEFEEGGENTGSTLSFNLGGVYQFDSFQVGIFLGTDLLAGANASKWKYQGKPWLGLAVGLSLFSTDPDKMKTGSNKDK